MPTRETELPGVGRKHTLDLAAGGQIVVVEHRVGHWELCRLDEEGNTTTLAKLQPTEAAELGRILARGERPVEDPRAQMLFDEFGLEWIKLETGSALVGETLQGSEIRARTGASVIAVLRPEGSLPSPPPDTELRAGDTLVVIGRREQVERFVEIAAVRSLANPPA
jgi:TrkA domain protein